MTVLENTNSEVMHNFILPYESTMKTASDANAHVTTANRFSLNDKTVEEVDTSARIIPTPYHSSVSDAPSFTISGISLENWQLLDNLRIGAMDLLWKLNISGNSDPHQVAFEFGTLPPGISGAGSYAMKVTKEGTTITATDASGLFHGLMSFIGLLDVSNVEEMTLKEMTIYDKPRFDYRGHQVDVARNFRSKEAIMNTIDAMALWKVSEYTGRSLN